VRVADLTHGRLGREVFLASFGVALSDLEPWVVDRITSLLVDRWVSTGTILYREGEPPEDLYFMLDGAVRLSRDGVPPWILRGRWVVGAMEGMADSTRMRTATALTEFQAMEIPIRDWVELLEDSFPLARAAVLNAARSTAHLEERVPVFPPAPRRVKALPSDGPLGLVERLALLADVRMLGVAGVQSIVDLAAASRETHFEAGATLLERGAERHEILLVVSGEVAADRLDPSVERRYGPGDIVCGVASFGAPAPLWQARAVTATRVISFPVEVWFDLMEEHFDLVKSALAAVGRRREVLLEQMAQGREELELR
jgi:CRP-like cAMP-binding protein